MYVWFDALTNYLTGIGYPDGADSKFWPANAQVIGKDITWFHCVIWPCLLMSANILLPATVAAHGFVLGGDGLKMSKSIGNVVDPYDVLSRHSVDTFRYFVIRDSPFGKAREPPRHPPPPTRRATPHAHTRARCPPSPPRAHRAPVLCAGPHLL